MFVWILQYQTIVYCDTILVNRPNPLPLRLQSVKFNEHFTLKNNFLFDLNTKEEKYYSPLDNKFNLWIKPSEFAFMHTTSTKNVINPLLIVPNEFFLECWYNMEVG